MTNILIIVHFFVLFRMHREEIGVKRIFNGVSVENREIIKS